MRNFLLVAFLACVSGCNGTAPFNSTGIFGVSQSDRPVPLESPTGNQVHSYLNEFSSFGKVSIVSGTDYVFAGMSYVDHHCENYFNALELRRRRVALRKDVVTSAVFQSISILNALSKSLAVTYVTAGGAVAQQFFSSYDQNYNYSNYTIELRRLAREAQSNLKRGFLEENISDYSGSINNATTLLKSHAVVQIYAVQCTPAQFETFISTALSGSTARPSTDQPQKSSAPTAFRAGSGAPVSVIAAPPFVAMAK